MRQNVTAACLLSLLCLAATAHAQGVPPSSSSLAPTRFSGGNDKERAAVLQTTKRWGERLAAGDVEGMLDLYEPDAIIFSSGRPAVAGRDAIRAVLARLVNGPRPVNAMHVEELSIEGPTAFATLLSASRVTGADGTSRTVGSRTVVTFRRGGDGVWRFARDVDMPTPDADVLLARLPGAREHDLAVLRQIHDDWIAAYTAGNVDALQRFYLDDTVLMPDGRPTFRGWSQIRPFFAPGFERFNYAAKADLQTLEVSGDLATAKGVVTVTLTPKAGGEPVSRSLRYLIVFKRVAQDDWRIYLDMDNAAV